MWKGKKIYDISMEISPEMPVYKGRQEKKPEFKVLNDYSTADSYESSITFNMHTGTHLDAPLHMIKDGATIDEFLKEEFFYDSQVLDLTNLDDKVKAEDLKKFDIKEGSFILLKTKNSYEDREEDFIFLAEDAAEHLIEQDVKGIGIDSLGIERSQEGHPTHKKLLSNEIFILEGLRLRGIEEGQYTLGLFPLNIQGVEATLCRAILLEL
ncbi:cyclase family protein [Natronospora cellulosivora (SeqCode)]